MGNPKPAMAQPPVPKIELPKPKVQQTPMSMNLEGIKKKDFQDEFMEKYDEFSESWRQLIEQGKRF